MITNTKRLVSISEANQNFSKVARMVDQNGEAVILKNNKPKYVLINFEEFEALKFDAMSDRILEDNIEAFKELAK